MSDTTPHDGTTTPKTDAAPARSEPARSEPARSEPARSEPALTYPPVDTPAADAPAQDAALAAATERANSGSLPGEYTDSESTDQVTASHAMGSSATNSASTNSAATNSAATGTFATPDEHSTATVAAAAPVEHTSEHTSAYAPTTSTTSTTPATSATPAAQVAPVQPTVQTPIYVQAPTPPKDRSNRGGGILIALVGTLVYAAIYAAAVFAIVGLSSSTIAETTRVFSEFLVRPVFYVPVVFFFLAFALLVSLVNRAGWWSYVLFGFLVAVVVYLSYVGSVLLTVQSWTLSSSEIASVLSQQWFAPFAIAAAVIAREVPIWFGAWISRRGRSVTSRNLAARTEYERVLAEGPQVARAN